MSQRSSFTTEYIYCDEDYKNLLAHLDGQGAKHKYLCICDPFTYCQEPMPIIAGKIGSMALNNECFELVDYLEGFCPKHPIRLVVVAEGSDGPSVQILDLMPDGRIVVNEVRGRYGATDTEIDVVNIFD